MRNSSELGSSSRRLDLPTWGSERGYRAYMRPPDGCRPAPSDGKSRPLLFPRQSIQDEDTALDWWEHEFAPWCEAINVQCTAAILVHAVVSSIREIRGALLDTPLSLTEAAHASGYSRDHLGREVRAGRIPNAGRLNAPRIERRYLPRKPGALPCAQSETTFDRRQIALSVVNSNQERHDD